MHTVKWFQILQYNSHNLIQVICEHTVCSIWALDRTLSGATATGPSGPGSNENEGELHIPQISTAGASPSDCLGGSLGEGREDADNVFYSPSRMGYEGEVPGTVSLKY